MPSASPISVSVRPYALAPWGYTLMRFSAGAVVVYHGYAKLFAGFAPVVAKNVLTPLGFPLPVVWAYFLGVLELVGGAALAIGLLTRPLALLFVIELAIVTYWHSGNGYFFTSPGGGWEFPLLLMLQYLGISIGGCRAPFGRSYAWPRVLRNRPGPGVRAIYLTRQSLACTLRAAFGTRSAARSLGSARINFDAPAATAHLHLTRR
jgi:putative oxidoreductase